MDIPVGLSHPQPPLGIRNPSQEAQHKALLQCRDLVVTVTGTPGQELTGAILWDLVDFFVGDLRIQVCPKDRITPIESYDLGMGFGP